MTETIEQIPTPLDIHFVQGDSLSRTLHFTQDGSDVDVSDWEITSQIRRRANSTSFISFDVDMTQASDGLVTISIAPEDAALLANSCVWDLQRILPSGDVRTLLAGAVTADREVTRNG